MADSNVYTAESIIDKKTRNGVTLYLIKWKGYSRRDSTWEPVENIIDRSLLTAYEKKEEKKDKKTKRTKRSHANSVTSRTKRSDDRENAAAKQTSPVIEPEKAPTPRLSGKTNNDQQDPASLFEDTDKEDDDGEDIQPQKIEVKGPIPNDRVTPVTVVGRSPVPAPSPHKPQIEAHSVEKVVTKPIELNHSNKDQLGHSSESSRQNSIARPEGDKKNQFNQQANNFMNNLKNKRSVSRFAIMNTVITDVTVNDQTITISESKTNQGFFKEVSRHSVAVDTTR